MKVFLRLEIQGHYGNVLKSFKKEVNSEVTPTKDMVFTSEDYTLEARTVYFDIDDGSVVVRFVENAGDNPDEWDFLEESGWTKS